MWVGPGGWGVGGVTYLQLPENLRLATGLEVLQSLGPEAALLVQGAVAAWRADESTTMQEPQGESSAAASGPPGAAPKRKKVFPARVPRELRGKSRTLSSRMPSPLGSIGPSKEFNFTKVTPKKVLKKGGNLKECDRSSVGKKKTCEETDKADASWGGHSGAVLSRHFWCGQKVTEKKKDVKHQTARGGRWGWVSKVDERENT